MMYLITACLSILVGAALVYVLVERARSKTTLNRERAEHAATTAKAAYAQAQELHAAVRLAQAQLDMERAAFDARSVTRTDLERENVVLKRDLLNIDIAVRKLQIDRKQQTELQSVLDGRGHELAAKYLADVEKWVLQAVTANNYAACKARLVKAIEWCREIGFVVSEARENELLTTLKSDFEAEVRKAIEREEQARIKAQIREEQQREKKVERALQSVEREKLAIHEALQRALADTTAVHTQEIEALRLRLAEAEARGERAKSQAQLTRCGHIYVISNVGSFGEDVFKIGMTRRLDPLDRICELGDASVPFPFDVHMMIACEDAPALEMALHREFHKLKINKVNPRREFFKVDLDKVRKFVVARCGEVSYVATPEAFEYRQSLSMSDADEEFIEAVYEEAEEEARATS